MCSYIFALSPDQSKFTKKSYDISYDLMRIF